MTITGYFRVTQYGKGWDFYAHEPIFWFKLLLYAILGASSLFPTIKIIQRALHAKNFKDGKRPDAPLPMSDKLANRMTKIVNGTYPTLPYSLMAILPHDQPTRTH